MAAQLDRPPGIASAHVLARLGLCFLPIALVTVGLVLALYQHDRGLGRKFYEQAGSHIIDLQAEIINRELKLVQSDLLFLANQAILVDFASGGATRKDDLEKEYSLFAQQRGVYDQVRYLDATGQERIRVNAGAGGAVVVPESGLQSKADRYYFWGTMRIGRSEVFVSPFDLNVEHGEIEQPLKPTIRFATAVFDKSNNKQGILVLNYLGSELIGKLKRVAGSFPGWTALLNRKGYFLSGRTSADEWGFMLGHQTTFASYFPQEWLSLCEDKAGQISNAHGLTAFRSIDPGARIPVDGTKGADLETGDPGLIVVSQIPVETLERQANLVLQRLVAFSLGALLLVFGLSWYLVYAAALRRHHEVATAESEARLRTLSTQMITAQEDERRKLSRDLHDELGQVVTAVTLTLQRAAQAGDANKKNELIAESLQGADLILRGIHEISGRVRPTILDDLGLKDAVQNLLGEFERRSGIAARSDLRFDRGDVPSAVAENVYRILQEALTNVTRHSGAKEVAVELHVTAEQVFLAVRDRGVGFAPVAPVKRGLGLLGMRERAELLHGVFQIKASPGAGTEIEVTIPIGKNVT